jgi:hypothetical protein
VPVVVELLSRVVESFARFDCRDNAVEDTSGCASDWVEDRDVSTIDETCEGFKIDAPGIADEADVSTVLDMKEVEKIVSSGCVIIGCPSGLTYVIAGCVFVYTVRWIGSTTTTVSASTGGALKVECWIAEEIFV